MSRMVIKARSLPLDSTGRLVALAQGRKMGAGGPYIKNITSPERHYYDNCVGGDPSEHESTFEFYSMQ
jgi:hypothetical protein